MSRPSDEDAAGTAEVGIGYFHVEYLAGDARYVRVGGTQINPWTRTGNHGTDVAAGKERRILVCERGNNRGRQRRVALLAPAQAAFGLPFLPLFNMGTVQLDYPLEEVLVGYW